MPRLVLLRSVYALAAAAFCSCLGLLLAQHEDANSFTRPHDAPRIYWELPPIDLEQAGKGQISEPIGLVSLDPSFLYAVTAPGPAKQPVSSPALLRAMRNAAAVNSALAVYSRDEGLVSVDRASAEVPLSFGGHGTIDIYARGTTLRTGDDPVLGSQFTRLDFGVVNGAQALAEPVAYPDNLVRLSQSEDVFQREESWRVLLATGMEPDGALRFAMWLTRPDVVRLGEEDQSPAQAAGEIGEIQASAPLSRFWSAGSLVENPAWGRARWHEDSRSPLLDVDVNPAGPWDHENPVAVLAIALEIGVAPQREWLLLAHAPGGARKRVAVRIPGYAEVLVDATSGGSFYLITEASATVEQILLDRRPAADTQSPASEARLSGASGISLGSSVPLLWNLNGSSLEVGATIPNTSGPDFMGIVRRAALSASPGIQDFGKTFDGGFATVDDWGLMSERNLTFCSWINPIRLPEAGRLAVVAGTFSSDNRGWATGIDDHGRIFLALGNGAKPLWILSSKSVSADEWHNVCVTYSSDSSLGVIYLDGVREVAGGFTGVALRSDAPLTFGRASWADTYYLAAVLDEISYSPSAKTAAQVLADYTASSPQPPLPTNELIARWTFDGATETPPLTVVDSSGYQHHATTAGGGTFAAPGPTGVARMFDGGHLSVGLTPALSSKDFTISALISPAGFPEFGRLAVIYSSFSPDKTGWMLGLNFEGRVVLSVADGATAPWLVSKERLALNQWRHITASYDSLSGVATLYLEGQIDVSARFVTALPNFGTAPTIGRASWVNTYFYFGAIDDLAIYRGALSATEIASRFRTIASEALQTEGPPRTPVAWWKLDEPNAGSGFVLADSSGYGHSASVAGGGSASVSGRLGKARAFSGAYGATALTDELKSPSFTVSAWVSPSSFPARGRLAVVCSSFSHDNRGWVVGVTDAGRVVLSIGTGTGAPWLVSSGTLALGDWRHVTATFDARTQTARIYLDGDLDVSGSFVGAKVNTSVAPTIGRASWADTYYFYGALDDVKIYQVGLNGAEVYSTFRAYPGAQTTTSEFVVRNAAELRQVFASGVPAGTTVLLEAGDYVGPFHSGSIDSAMAGTSTKPITLTSFDPRRPAVIHWKNSWLGPLRFVDFKRLNFTGRINIDGATSPSGRRNRGVSFSDLLWYLCGDGGGGECLKATKGDAMIVEHVTYFATQSYLAGLRDIGPADRARMSPLSLTWVDEAVSKGRHLGLATQMPIDFVAVNDSLVRAVTVERSGTHAGIQIKGGSSGNVVENNYLSAWAVKNVYLTNRNINLGGGTCDACFRSEGYRQFEAYNTVVRGNRIECGDACGAIATQIGTQWFNNTHYMAAASGACVEPATIGTRWAIRLLAEGASDHVDEVRPSQDAIFARNVWVYKYCSTNGEFINRSAVCADGTDLSQPGQDCIAPRSIQWKNNVLYELDWRDRVDTLNAYARVRHCHKTVGWFARDWERTGETELEFGGLGDISEQCKLPQGDYGLDPKLVDEGTSRMRITEPSYVQQGIGANVLFPAGNSPAPGAFAGR